MLVRLTSSTSGEMIMFAKHAHALFDIMGKVGAACGVFTTEQLPEAIVALKRAVDEEKLAAKLQAREAQDAGSEESEDEERDRQDDDSDEAISLGRRAMPLIRLMEWTLKEKGFILWEAPDDF